MRGALPGIPWGSKFQSAWHEIIRGGARLIAPNLDCLLQPGREAVGLNHSSAGVPTKKRVIVIGRAEGFSLFKPFHGFAQKLVGIMAGTGMALEQPRLGLSLADYARVIGALIGILET